MGEYYTLANARDDGITLAEASNDVVNEEINTAEEMLEKWTGRKFYARDLTLRLDGTGTEWLDLVRYRPINSISSVTIDSQSISVSDYIVIYYEGGYLRIKREGWSVYSGSTKGYYAFSRGSQNNVIVGNFGFETVPYNIKKIIKKMIFGEIRPREKTGEYDSEKMGNYSYKIRKNEGKMDIFTGNPEIDRLIRAYKHKISFKAITRGWT